MSAMRDARRAVDQRLAESRSARATAKSSSTLPPAYISATTTPASGSPSAERADHRDERDGVDAQATGHQIANHRNQEADRDRHGRGRPEQVREVALTGNACSEACRQPKHGNGDQPAA